MLVTGSGLPRPRDDVDACFRFLLNLSRKLGEVQFFSASRTCHYHAWVKVQNGRIVRAYAWAGATLWLQGTPTPSEQDLDLKCLNYAEETSELSSEGLECIEANADKVPLLAARWGLDPAGIQKRFLLEEHGVLGQAAYRY